MSYHMDKAIDRVFALAAVAEVFVRAPDKWHWNQLVRHVHLLQEERARAFDAETARVLLEKAGLE